MGITKKKDVGLAIFDGDEYPPKKWTCPYCDKQHGKAHFSHPGQIDYTKEPAETGRVTFNREEVDSYKGCEKDYKDDTAIKAEFEGKTGDATDIDGNPRPMFCPHCGWEAQIVVIRPSVTAGRGV